MEEWDTNILGWVGGRASMSKLIKEDKGMVS